MKNQIKKVLLIILGAAIAGYAVSSIYIPNKIVSGGLSGFATILYYAFGIPAGVSVTIINTVLLIISLCILGKRFVAGTVFGAALYSVFIQLFSYVPPLTDDVFLATIFGAILYGVGIGIVLTCEATLGGTDIISRLLQHVNPQAKIGTILAVVDGVVIFMSLLMFRNINLALYGIIALILSCTSINVLIKKLNVSRLVFVVTDFGEEIAKKLVSTSPRGVTILNGTGAYTFTDKNILVCAMKEDELDAFQKKIYDIDKNAFIMFSEAQEISGNGFRIYR